MQGHFLLCKIESFVDVEVHPLRNSAPWRAFWHGVKVVQHLETVRRLLSSESVWQGPGTFPPGRQLFASLLSASPTVCLRPSGSCVVGIHPLAGVPME